MCQIVRFNGEEIETVQELIDLIGEENIVVSEHYGTLDQYSCLCQVDLEKTFKKAGYVYTVDGMDWIIEKNTCDVCNGTPESNLTVRCDEHDTCIECGKSKKELKESGEAFFWRIQNGRFICHECSKPKGDHNG